MFCQKLSFSAKVQGSPENPQGAPPLIACVLLVLTGVSTVSEAFSDFVNQNVIMIAGFLVVTNAMQKTRMLERAKQLISSAVGHGGIKSYMLLLLLIVILGSIDGGSSFFLLVLTIVSAIPYTKEMPVSKLILPVGYAASYPILPLKVAMTAALSASLLESSGVAGVSVSIPAFSVLSVARSVVFLIWACIAYRFMPDHPINGFLNNSEDSDGAQAISIPKWKENCIYGTFIFTFFGIMFMSKLGEAGYVISGVAAVFLFLTGCVSFKEVRNSISSPMIIMVACVIGVAGALSNTGFTSMVGELIAGSLGNGLHPLALLLVFGVVTGVCAVFTGAGFGTMYIFAPIGISLCVSMGYSPVAMAVVVNSMAMTAGFMPIDTQPAMMYSIGKYTLKEFWTFTIPMYLLQILTVCVGSLILFPM